MSKTTEMTEQDRAALQACRDLLAEMDASIAGPGEAGFRVENMPAIYYRARLRAALETDA